MASYAIMSILRSIEPTPERTFDSLYTMIGQNTGNLLFTNAVWEQVGGQKTQVGFSFDPNVLNDRYDALIIPAANWLGATVDFSDLADRCEKLNIPIVIIGLGAQDTTYSGEIPVPDGTRRFARLIAERCTSLSVRGAYTASILESWGISNVTVTGCPSLYFDFAPFSTSTFRKPRFDKGLIHSTRYAADYSEFANAASIQRGLFRYAYANHLDILYQSEPEEIGSLVASAEPPEIDGRRLQNLLKIYGASSEAELLKFIETRGRTYFSISSWAGAVQHYDFVFGSRLHGTIMALNCGVPAILITHDSRTAEIAEFAQLPHVPQSKVKLTRSSVRRAFEKANFEKYYETREQNKHVYRSFLSDNGILATDF